MIRFFLTSWLCTAFALAAAAAIAAPPRPGLITPYGYSGVGDADTLLERDSLRPESGAPRSAVRRSIQPVQNPPATAGSAAPSIREPRTSDPGPAEEVSRSATVANPAAASLRMAPGSTESVAEPIAVQRRHVENRFEAAVAGAPVPPEPRAADTGLPPRAPTLEGQPHSEPLNEAPIPEPGRVILGDDRTIYFQPAYVEPERHWLPSGLLYKSYLAGEKESRFALQTLNESGRGLIWEVALGGRVGIYRWGPLGTDQPSGWQLDIEGASFVRLDLDHQQDVDAVDFRFGIPITYRDGRWAYKTGYYHISSHTGDEYMVKYPDYERINYVRDSFLLGISYDTTPDTRVYGEVAYAWHASGGAEPWELQFGGEYSPARAGGAPFAAINVHLREDFNFGGSVNMEAGWQWRGADSGHLLRVGGQHYNGKSMQYSFYNRSEALTGLGIWFDY